MQVEGDVREEDTPPPIRVLAYPLALMPMKGIIEISEISHPDTTNALSSSHSDSSTIQKSVACTACTDTLTLGRLLYCSSGPHSIGEHLEALVRLA